MKILLDANLSNIGEIWDIGWNTNKYLEKFDDNEINRIYESLLYNSMLQGNKVNIKYKYYYDINNFDGDDYIDELVVKFSEDLENYNQFAILFKTDDIKKSFTLMYLIMKTYLEIVEKEKKRKNKGHNK